MQSVLYKMNLVVLPQYKPVWVSGKDGSFGCHILVEPLLVDDQTAVDDLCTHGDDGDVTDQYWNYPVPLLIQWVMGPPMIVSKHSVDIRRGTKTAVRSLIVPSPCDIIRMTQGYGGQDSVLYQVDRVGKGDPIIIVPEILRGELDDTMINPHVVEDVFECEDGACGAYAIVIDPYDSHSDTDIIHVVSKGAVTLYIKEIQLNKSRSITRDPKDSVRYILSVDITDYPVWLCIDTLEYRASRTREGLLQQISTHIRVQYVNVPVHFSDVEIIC